MIFEGIILAMLFGYMRKGKMKNLENVTIQYWYLFMVAFALQTIAFALASIPESGFFFMHVASYLLIIYVCYSNRRFFGMWFMGIGTFLNGLVIAVNNGKMPVKLPEHAEGIFDRGHTLLTETTNLWLLADIFIIDIPRLSTRVMSIGDFFIVFGVFYLIQQGMQTQAEQSEK
jgi:hypothetical protein